jgi:hypothetical protein
MPRGLVEVDQFSGEYTAPILRVNEQVLKAARLIFDPKDGGGIFLRNIGKLLPDYLFRFQKITIFTVAANEHLKFYGNILLLNRIIRVKI